MNRKSLLQPVLHFFLTKMVAGVAIIGALMVLVEWVRSYFLDRTHFSNDAKEIIVAIAEACLATRAYIFLFKMYDKRHIDELSRSTFLTYSISGFFTGLLLQSFFIWIIYLFGTFLVTKIHPLSTLWSPVAFALSAGFVVGIIMIGVVFRLLEQQIGTVRALVAFMVLFALLHVNSTGATLVSVGATAMQAGFMLPASYVFSRSLWLPIFLHLGWDVTEPGIFGAINPSTSLSQGLLRSKIAGNILLTGGEAGPQDSLSSLLLCLLVGTIFLLLAKSKNNLLKPPWTITATKAG